ncbi:MAG: stage II sporulation protein R [Clostridia bacterium]|nr:stage II sporulation protein R [Clostridia bacterium]
MPNKRLIIPALIAGLIITAAGEMLAYSGDVCEVSDAVMRLHVVAQSDDASDQAAKLCVRDAVLREVEALADAASDKREFASLLAAHIPDIERTANDTLAGLGLSYTARAYIERADFPTREYGDVTLPAGRYDALRVVLGRGAGHNFWCVMFPPMCAGAVEEEEGKEYLKENLRPGAFMMITDSEADVRYELRLKVADVISGLKNK